MTAVSEISLDWSEALPYRKSSILLASNVRASDGGEHIITLNSEGKVEREGTTVFGDKVVTDSRGQPYIIKAEKFGQLYEIDPSIPTQFHSKNYGVAFQTQAPLTIARKDGTEVTAAAGDYVFHSQMTNTVNVIAGAEFDKTYKLDTQGRASQAMLPSQSPSG